MKKSIFIALILLIQNATCIFANVPDMEFFLPTEYQLISELDEKDAQSFVKDKKDFIEKCEFLNLQVLDGREFPEQKVLYDRMRVFSESVNGEKYLWVLLPVTRNEYDAALQKNYDWIPKYQYLLALFREKNSKDELLFIMPTYHFSSDFYTVNTFQIVKGKDRNKGIIHYQNMLGYDDLGNHRISYRETKGQACGTVGALYFLLDDDSRSVEFNKDTDFGFFPNNWNTVFFIASNFLWELKKPLKYGLQNAFDHNPATSYVENTDTDLMRIEIFARIGYISNVKPFEKMAIINGYAANKNLYKANNSVKEISTYSVTFLIETDFEISEEWKKTKSLLCESDNMNYQVFDFSEPFYSVTVDSFYKGTKYNDTCLAELNLFCNGEWLFGDIEEK